MSLAVLIGLLSAVANAISSVLSKELTRRLPARQLIGPLFALNAAVVLPALPFATFQWNATIVALHLISVALLVFTSLAVWDLFDNGAASATVTAQSISPLPTALAVALLLPGTLGAVQVLSAVVVVLGVLLALAGAFGALSRRRTMITVITAALGTGLVTVMGRLLADQGVGVVETYFIRTSGAALVFFAFIPPRDIPLHETPQLALRAVFVSAHFLLILVGVQRGSPAVVQTAVATAPLFVLGYESLRTRQVPSARLLVAALVALVGVSVILLA